MHRRTDRSIEMQTDMAPASSEPVRSAVVARLRAAGCVFAEDEARVLIDAARSPGELAAMLDRRVAGLPLEQVVGWADFCGLRVAVEPGVFVPRRRSEFLVRQAIVVARDAAGEVRPPAAASHRTNQGRRNEAPGAPDTVVVDLCCGSGAIGLALLTAWERVELHAVDLDPAAVRCARRNVSACGHVYEGDLYEPLPPRLRGHVDLLIANAPYVPTDAIGLLPAEARLHEPRAALDGGADGLEILRRVVDGAPAWLASGGCLLVECSDRQAGQLAAAVSDHGLSSQVIRLDALDATVVVGARLAPAARP